MPIWCPNAIDYAAGVDITDYKTGIVYTEEEALMLQAMDNPIVHRLLNKGRKIGCWLKTAEELKTILYARLKNEEEANVSNQAGSNRDGTS